MYLQDLHTCAPLGTQFFGEFCPKFSEILRNFRFIIFRIFKIWNLLQNHEIFDEILQNFEIRAAQSYENLVDTFGILFFFSQGALRGLWSRTNPENAVSLLENWSFLISTPCNPSVSPETLAKSAKIGPRYVRRLPKVDRRLTQGWPNVDPRLTQGWPKVDRRPARAPLMVALHQMYFFSGEEKCLHFFFAR